jgi:hypothetical protein
MTDDLDRLVSDKSSYDYPYISETLGSDAIHAKEDLSQDEGRRRRGLNQKKDEAKDHFGQLARDAETANKALVKKRSPYRFCVYREKDEIFIDVVVLDRNGRAQYIKKKNITHEEFQKMLQDIEDKEGLVIDESV